MKRFLSLALAVIMTFAIFGSVPFTESPFAIFASAADESVLTFTLSDDGTYYSVASCDTAAEGELTIPAEYEGLPVTRIELYAFQNRSGLTGITVPESITSIETYSFNGCAKLVAINVDENNTVYSSVDGILFSKNKATLLKYPMAKEGVSYTIPEGVTSIGSRAFGGCANLQSVEISDSVTEIEISAFENCINIKEITIPYSVTSIGDDIVTGCTSLEAINVDENNTSYCSVEGVLFNEAKIMLVRYPLNKSGSEYTMPDTVKILSSHAFEGCKNLTSVEISNKVSNIPDSAFRDCTGLTCIEIPWYAQHIGMYAFCGCTNLKTVVSYGSTFSVGRGAFRGCSSLESVTFYEGDPSIGSYAFYGCSGLKYIFYGDSEESWAYVTVDSGNTPLDNAIVHYNSTDHTFSTEWTVDVEPTCTEEGSKSYHCTQCDEKSDVTAIDALGHDLDEGTQTMAPACAEQGVLTKACQRENCTYTEDSSIDALGHDFSNEWTVDVEPTCEEEGSKSYHCSRCDEKSNVTAIDVLGHTLDEGTVTTQPTCTLEGVLTKSCTTEGCTYTEDSAIDALGHDYSTEWTVDIEPTCEEEGSKSYHCSRCDEKSAVTAIDALGHILDEGTVTTQPTCTVKGVLTKSCTRDDCTYTEDSAIDALGHDYSTEWTVDVEPTCTEEGSKSYHCSRCDEKSDVTAIDALGHILDEGTVTTQPTCTLEGVLTKSCTREGCTYTEDSAIDALGHDYSTAWTIDVEPTCTEEGSQSRHCTVCDAKTDITPIEIIPHPYSIEWTIDVEPTCTSEGSKSHHCTVCGDKTDVTVIEKLPHTPAEHLIHAPGFNCESGEMNYMHRLCTVCKQVVEAIEVAPGHSYVDGICEKCGNCDFSYTVSAGKVTITGYTGPKGEVTIPTTLGGYPVESIKAEAFSGNSNIVSIVIPDNLVTGDVVLKDMPNLTAVTLGNNITLSADAFSGCPAFEKLIFSDTVTAIPDNYLINNTVVKEIVLGSNVETIGVSAFENCTALENINLSNVSEIGSKAFYSCTSLYAVQLGDKIETINESVFEGCSSLSELTLGENLKVIGNSAFSSATNLQVVHFPEGLQTIGNSAFMMSGLQSVVIPDSVKTIGNMAFCYTISSKYFQLGKGLEYVGSVAFYGAFNTVFVVPKEVTGLNYGSICADGPTTVYYDGTEEQLNQLREIEAFYELLDTGLFGNGSIEYINAIPVSSGYTEDYCYFEYPAGEIQLVDYLGFDSNVTVPSSVNDKSVTDINCAFFPVMDISIILSVDQNKPEKNFAYMFSPTEVTIPETVTSIDDFSFAFARQLEKINLPETIVSIGNAAFATSGLKKINLPTSLERIGYDIFEDTQLQADASNWENDLLYWDNCLIDVSSNFVGDLVVKDGTHLIADGAATGNMEIDNIYLPESLEIIGESAFSGVLNQEVSIEGDGTTVSDPTQCIFYEGTEEQWKNITIHSDNDIFTILPIHYETTDHILDDEWLTEIVPGCTHNGVKYRKCKFCTYKIEEEIPATGHTLENGVCKYCTSEVVESDHNYVNGFDKTVLLHNETAGSVSLVFSADTYVENGYDYIYIYDGEDNLVGKYTDNELANQTIVVQGSTVKIRLTTDGSVEYYGYYADVLWACAHTPGEPVNAIKPTCTEDGYTGDIYCRDCSYLFSEGEVIKATGHVMVNGFCQNCDHSVFGYSIADGQVTIEYYNGEDTIVEIPSTIGGYPVTALGEVFSETPVAQVIIPASVASIDMYCFPGAYNLTSITVAEDNPNYTSEDGVLFNKEKTALIVYPANKADEVYEIPEGVVEIEPYAFGYTKNLKEVVFPETTTTINDFAFYMSSLENFNYTDSIKTVGNYAFAYTDAVKFIEINENTEFIGEYAFLNFGVICVLPASVENLSQASIYGISDMTVYYDGTEEQMAQLIADEKIVCDGNLTVIYGESVTPNTYGVFRYIETTDGEISIYDYNGNDKVVEIPSEINGKKVVDIRNTFTNLQYDFETGKIVSSPIEKIIVPDTVCKLSSYAFSGNGRLYEVILPDNITHIGSDIFNETTVYYTELNWYEGGLYVGNYLVDFSGSPSTIKIKDGTKLLADDVIGHDTKEIYLPASVEYIGENIFSSSTNLTSVFYGGNQEQWKKIIIAEDNDGINNAVIHYNATGHTNGNWIVDTLPTATQTGSRHKECSVCGNVTEEEKLPATTGFEYELNNETCTLISFYDTQAEVIIPEEYNGKPVTAIGSGCFKDDMFVESIIIPETVTEIGSLAFMNCENLETVRIPESVTSIGKRAFYGFSGKIICYYGSFAHQYAHDNGIDYFAITIEAIDSLTSVDYENNLIFTTMEATQQLSELIKTASVLDAESSVEVSYYGTGNIIQVKENGTIIEEYTLVVDGDLNGDSVCDVLDAFFAGRVVNEHATATTAQVYAANGEISDEIDIITYQRLVNKAVS